MRRCLSNVVCRTDGIQTVSCSVAIFEEDDSSPNFTVPCIDKIKNNETVKIQCVDWTGGQIKNNDSADDVRDVDLTKIHYLTGPFEIETAEPGDVLVVDIQDVQPLPDQPWGFTGIFAKKNGGGFLDEIYPKPYVQCKPSHSRLLLIAIAERRPSGTSRASIAPLATSPACVSQVSSIPVSWVVHPPMKC